MVLSQAGLGNPACDKTKQRQSNFFKEKQKTQKKAAARGRGDRLKSGRQGACRVLQG
jgi:hypothetical protein